MTNTISMISIDSHGTAMKVELFQPARAKGGAVVVAHGSDGMNDPWAAMIREYATELAGKGYTALIPHYFEKTGSGIRLASFLTIPQNVPSWQEAVNDTIAHVKTLPGISASRIGLLGFSLGGHLCLRVRGSAKVVVEFFAPQMREFGGVGSVGTPAPHVQIQIHHGLADSVVPFSEAQGIAATLKREGTVAEVFSYEGAGHGFAGADPNNATARRSSKDRTLAFFEKHL